MLVKYRCTDLLVEPVSDGGGGGLVDDTQHVHTGDGTGVLGGLTLGIVEVRWNCDNGILHGLYNKNKALLSNWAFST